MREVLVFGRAPEQAYQVVLDSVSGPTLRVKPFEGLDEAAGDFYLFAVTPAQLRGRVNWLDQQGELGSRGIALIPER
ncbi:MAG TPA: hypothetical protein VHJ37_01460 [Thermoleophilaceae bacterium]|nr:hypothetical protein [Thermoleophilaceae bacterium]